jgi:hypothetical protein
VIVSYIYIYFNLIQGGIILVLNTPNIEGKKIVKYIGLLSGETILDANIFKDIFAGIRDIVGSRSARRDNGFVPRTICKN